MQFKIGDKVGFLHEPGWGIVQEVLPNYQYKIEDEDGFSVIRAQKDLVPVYSQDFTVDKIQKGEVTSKKQSKKSGKRKPEQVWEIDLHLDELVDAPGHVEFSKMLQIQMNHCRSFIQKAKKSGIRKVVVIHGVGQGVLKESVRNYAFEIDAKEYHDADFRQYGRGATEIVF